MKKRVLIIILSILFLCMGCGTLGMTAFIVNGETSYVQLVEFRKNYVALPLGNALLLLGAEYVGNDIRLNDKYFIFDYKKHMLFMEDERTYLQNDDSSQSDLRSREKSLLPSENITDDDDRYLFWGDAVVCADHKTLINILHAAGIELQVDVDFEHEVVYYLFQGDSAS